MIKQKKECFFTKLIKKKSKSISRILFTANEQHLIIYLCCKLLCNYSRLPLEIERVALTQSKLGLQYT